MQQPWQNLMAADGAAIDGEAWVMNDPYLIGRLMDNEGGYFTRIVRMLRSKNQRHARRLEHQAVDCLVGGERSSSLV